MDTQEFGLEIPSPLYLDLRLWLAEYLPSHVDQTERLEELRIALAVGELARAVVTMHALVEMATYVPNAEPQRNGVWRRGMALLPELVAVAEQAGQWDEGDQRDADVAFRGASMWVRHEKAKDRALVAGTEVA